MTNIQISAIFFVVGVLAVAPVLYYHYRKHPNPRFRPPIGEMVMLSLFALMFVGGGSYFMGTLLSADPDFDKDIRNRPDRAQPQQQDSNSGSKPKKKESKNPFGF